VLFLSQSAMCKKMNKLVTDDEQHRKHFYGGWNKMKGKKAKKHSESQD